jgi:hypothetical protein
LRDAEAGRITAIGEAARQINAGTEAALPSMPFKDIRGMLNRIAHDYDGINFREVWKVAEQDITPLAPAVTVPNRPGSTSDGFLNGCLDQSMVYLLVYLMPTIATKLPNDLAHEVQRAAKTRKTTVSAFLRLAVEHEVAGGQGETFGSRFGHLFGAAKKLPADASRKEGYED